MLQGDVDWVSWLMSSVSQKPGTFRGRPLVGSPLSISLSLSFCFSNKYIIKSFKHLLNQNKLFFQFHWIIGRYLINLQKSRVLELNKVCVSIVRRKKLVAVPRAALMLPTILLFFYKWISTISIPVYPYIFNVNKRTVVNNHPGALCGPLYFIVVLPLKNTQKLSFLFHW